MAQRNPEQRKQREGRAQHDEVKPPMQRAGQHRLSRQPRAVQEEKQRDRQDRRDVDDVGRAAEGILAHLETKRRALKLAPMLYQNGVRATGVAPRTLATYVAPTGLVALGCGKAQERSQARPPEE